MDIRPIRTDRDHAAALAEIERLWSAEPGTPEGDRLDVLATLVDVYEKTRWPIGNPTPIQAIEFVLEQRGMSRRGLEPILGVGSGRVSEVMTGKRALTVEMIRRLSAALHLPADLLIGETKPRNKRTVTASTTRGASRTPPRRGAPSRGGKGVVSKKKISRGGVKR